ncbi:MAG: hypothetical protein HYR66_03970 [Sphingobacteriales bacterium]|nr:hypothetical protein [Sphingobacteriales bacterium]MBI3718934.1 hypothetical protein [Sphingobacteriales bacterium]
MKRKLLSTVLAICLLHMHSFSQEINFRSAKEKETNKKALFSNAAERVSIGTNFIQKVFELPKGKGATIKFADNLQLAGEVVTNDLQPNLQTITMKCTNYPGALLTISKVTLQDGSVMYSGAILNQQSKDIIMLEKDAAGNYAWQKKNLSDLIED